jgi:hypothetical protein
LCLAACEERRKEAWVGFPGSKAANSKGSVRDQPDVLGKESPGRDILLPNARIGPVIIPGLNGEIEKWTGATPPPGGVTPARPAAPAEPLAPSGRSEGEGPKTRIIDTRSAPLLHPGEEPEGYGLYTYVLLRQSADRDSHFLKDIVATAPSASGVALPLRTQIDLMLIPANPCPPTPAKSPPRCPAPQVETVANDPKAAFNYDESNAILEELCANPPKQISGFCREPIGQGPFLFTYARPVTKMNPIPPPFLFFDFTDHEEAAFPDYIEAYETVPKSDDFTDDSKLNTLRLRILDVFNRARAVAGPTTEGAIKLVHLFSSGGEE